MNNVRKPFADRVRWFRYTLPEGRQVLLTQRPDIVLPEPMEAWLKQENPCIRFCFCDDWVQPPMRGPDWHWYPWPLRKLTLESVFAMLSMMEYVKTKHDIARPVWMHCDSSTQRAPTNFGLFLFANYDRSTIEQIVADVQYSPDRELNIPLYESPIDYAEIAFQMENGIGRLVTAWRNEGPAAAHETYMAPPKWRKWQ